MTTFLFKKIDNAGLILFRIFFGILISLESFGAILTGWVKANLVEPTFNFSFIGFEWLNIITGPSMYAYFIIMGITGIFISVGYKYRYSMLAFALLWSCVYLMQKTSYNNHYYLLMLISWIMVFFPANTDLSVDAKNNPELRTTKMHAYYKYIIVLQLTIVYTYASVAKLYADWLDFGFIKVLMQNKADYFLIGEFLQLAWVHKIVAVFGILFDLLIIPALLWKPSRKIAFILAIFFHLFNSIVFQIGIFPYLALAFTVFFFEPQKLRDIFFLKEKKYKVHTLVPPKHKKLIVGIWVIYFLFQLGLPIRHHFFKDNVLWTEEGHRLSWRMMLRSRSGSVTFTTVDKDTNEKKRINLNNYLTKKQRRKIGAYPDFIWQFAQHLKKEAKKENKNIAVYVNSRVSINGKPYQPFIDPKVDLAQEKWHHFKHNNFILPSPK
ncbi:vitamin K-dependent gamma-carboxylase-like protein [Cellulophaga sp. RHA_52]|uniref:HTTM domain-containing protein n=1 Tax=Cellulophaga TaxID=104264 RepID=UPI0011999193|nr:MULTISPECIES: HTTM domain-containing protein [Cellulophaga]MDO6852380.1 HTTM domain-containing protein [Cellulophaga lytica]TVZ07861.1 vitamin K-dependent gamma-carboxylase-like protein [Cellulophaga sp. RHA_52]